MGFIAHGYEATLLNATRVTFVPASLEPHHPKFLQYQVTTENKGCIASKVSRAESSVPEKARGFGDSAKMQASINPSSIQQQFAFAAGLATAEGLSIATPNETVLLSQVSSSTESRLPPTQQDPQLDQQSNTQPASQSSLQPEQAPVRRSQQEGQLNPGDDANQLTAVSQQPDDRAQPEQHDYSEAQLVSGPSPSGSSVPGDSVAGSSVAGSSGAGSSAAGGSSNGSSSSSSSYSAIDEGSSADAEVVEIEQMSFGERLQAGLDCFR